MRIRIEFCVAWNYTPRAASLAEALVNEYRAPVGNPHPIQEIALVPGSSGSYEISIDDKVIYSKLQTGQHISNTDAIKLIRQLL